MQCIVRLYFIAGVAASAASAFVPVLAVPAQAADIRCRDLCIVEAKGLCFRSEPVCYFDDGFSAGVYPMRPALIQPSSPQSARAAPIAVPYRPAVRSIPRR